MWVSWTSEVKQYDETLTNKQSQSGDIQLMKSPILKGMGDSRGGGLGTLNANTGIQR